ncbi:oxygen-insensitive NADPH nitroreductase [Bacillus thermotolerans]|uniref:NAD(P)H-flavin oxidoreductase n=1 Tax=Bacillus thermotolerans TaxID=1221996 RepID=A0A0F5HQJ0_BACTR|nr:oxygen-insensitive NADPH nitroreductase [Bacillus thermotolerans]KKB35102.1 NAD(P)H-flavin oxidoreductase [Bacillus thermotolerans]KKB43398.1 NAD(P)H-flavin oxidoreductase [Bacillus thermotolerans]KKB43481.1 NAD(P)H-flavin oxidoreductase [Bacillus thermotolerans]
MLDLLKSHASVRKYTDEPISDETFLELMETAQHAASSHFVQAYSVIRIKDEEKRKKLGELSKNEPQFESAALPLVFCADLKRLEKAVALHGKQIEGSTAENLLVAVIDTALLAQNFVVAAESKGYGICYIGGVRNNPEAISELLELPDYVVPLFGLTVGVPAERNEVKPRLPVQAIVHENSYDEEKYDELLSSYDEKMEEYYSTRATNQKNASWTGGMAAFLSKPRRPYMLEFLQSRGFIKK